MLTKADAELMALRQRVQMSRERIEKVIDALQNIGSDHDALRSEDAIFDAILALKHINDFILGEPK